MLSKPREEQRFTEIPYPISPEYVKDWTPARALVELIANALDEDSQARVDWADGILVIEDAGPGIPQEGFLLGASAKGAHQIGQFGEGKKLAALVLARDPKIGAVEFQTVGYRFVPAIKHVSLLEGIVPDGDGTPSAMLVYRVAPFDRKIGTRITVACPKDVAEEAISRVLRLTQCDYQPPVGTARILRGGTPGRIYIGGILVNNDPRLSVSYDLPLDGAKTEQNRDRSIVDGQALDQHVRRALSECADAEIIRHFVTRALEGPKIAPQETYFHLVDSFPVKRAFREFAQKFWPDSDRLYYTDSRNDLEDEIWLQERGAKLIESTLPPHAHRALMDLLGVERVRTAAKREARRNPKTKWTPLNSLMLTQRRHLDYATGLFRAAFGADSLGKVRVYNETEEFGCPTAGMYIPNQDVVCIHENALIDMKDTVQTVLHEGAHRRAYLREDSYGDRTSGFERALEEMGSALLELCAKANLFEIRLADAPAWGGAKLPAGMTLADPAEATSTRPSRTELRRKKMLEAAPAPRRLLAELAHTRMAEVCREQEERSVARVLATVALKPAYWRVVAEPRPAGWRRSHGVSCVVDYDKASALAELLGIKASVLWLAHMAPEGPLYDVRGPKNAARPWSARLLKGLGRAVPELAQLGGAYSEQIPAISAMSEGRTDYDPQQAWLDPICALVREEHRRLG